MLRHLTVRRDFAITSRASSSQRPRAARRRQHIKANSINQVSDEQHSQPQSSHNLVVSRSQLLQGLVVLAADQCISGMKCCSSKAAVQDSDDPALGLGPDQVRMESLAGCQLGISIYPTFSYNASGGGGVASATQSAEFPSRVDIVFDPKAVSIPDVTYSTAKVGGVPLLPMFRIRVQPESLQGWIDRATGEVELEFKASFWFTATSLYKAEPLLVTTMLTTGDAKGQRLGGTGELMDSNGYCKLVGVAWVQPSGSTALDTFLRLPADTLAVMKCRFVFPHELSPAVGSLKTA